MFRLFAYATLSLALLCASAAAATEHRVRRGETLTEIAQAYNITVEAITEANALSNLDQLSVGQRLVIPIAAPSEASYIIRKGDNLSDIAKRFGVTVDEIKAANNIPNANRLQVGQALVIPGVQSEGPANGLSYTIRSGDNLSDIAKRFGVSLSDIKSANRLINPNKLVVGQTIVIPGASAPIASAQISSYTIQKGDNLSDIAQRFGVSLAQLKAANNISDADLISVGQTLSIPSGEPQYVDYRIRNGDSLSDIAQRFRTSPSQLASLNDIRNPSRIRVGQVIRVPATPGMHVHAGGHYPTLDPSVQKTLASIRTKSNQWKHIVIHHSGTRTGTPKGMDRFHREERRMENGLAYHFVIGNGNGMKDGEIYIGDRWKRQIQGGHLSSYALNQISIGICLVGDFQKNRPTRQQLDQLEALVRYLMNRAGVPASRVTTHTLIHPKHTLCPGKNFPIDSFRDSIAN
ncbi:LysM peptidoglycan-binding domain-containing protein [Pelagicoccus sp. SDUM812003]|uniref:LysM peptidoglycan-binding domain-containing protein n=1 Tax=Pelagicoccus sp. SDUM812003 TaxID=3041267 RepID=UPI00280CEB2C|nr:LysM peptidoglycan-binding domain-containing protein [Pelagicoccus sp. SDUM812003]MDQ8201615.1 LysM peptidoglycan-binding domain-containing protein [Pelagicoccus sp. SDUM812003]